MHSYIIAPYSFSALLSVHIKTCQNDYIAIDLRFFDQPSVIFLAFEMWNICQTFVILLCDIRMAVILYIPCDIIFLRLNNVNLTYILPSIQIKFVLFGVSIYILKSSVILNLIKSRINDLFEKIRVYVAWWKFWNVCCLCQKQKGKDIKNCFLCKLYVMLISAKYISNHIDNISIGRFFTL